MAALLTSISNGRRKGESGRPFLTCVNLPKFESLKLKKKKAPIIVIVKCEYVTELSVVFGNDFYSKHLGHVSHVLSRKSNHCVC